MDYFIGTILPWPINFAPDGWLYCQGQVLQVNSYQALFSLIGNRFGGNGTTTFALPDLRGRIPLGVGQQPAGSPFVLAQTGGSETLAAKVSGVASGTVTGNTTGSATLTMANIPVHNHAMAGIPANSGGADSPAPGPTVVPASSLYGGKAVNSYSSVAPDVTLKAGGNTGDAGQATPTPISVTVPLNTPVNLNVTLPVIDNKTNAAPSNLQPFLVLNYIICYNGVYPTRP